MYAYIYWYTTVAVSPVPQGGVRPLMVLSHRYRLLDYRNIYRIIETFSKTNIETFDTVSLTWMHAAERSLVLFTLEIVTTLLKQLTRR